MLLISIELVLQVSGIVFLGNRVEKLKIKNPHNIKILVLGESTSDKNFKTKNKKAWPEYLEEEFKKNGIKADVYNHAKAAITTDIILNNIDELINFYKPQFVITMMGINDSDRWAIDVNNSVIGKVKLYRVLSYFAYLITENFRYKELDKKNFKVETIDVEKLTLKEKSQFYAYKAEQLVPEIPLPNTYKNIEKRYKEALALYAKSYQTGLFTKDVLSNYLWLLVKLGDESCNAVVDDYVNKGGILNFLDLMSAQNCYKYDRKNLKNSLNKNNEALKLVEINKRPTSNYNKINEKIISYGSTHVIMQYPTLSIDQIRESLKESDKNIFIENKKNFKKALLLSLIHI